MKACRKIKDLLPLYISNDVTEDECRIVTAHLDECYDCRVYQLALAAINRAIKPDKVEIPASYGAELVVALQERINRRIARQKRLLWAIPAFTSLAVILLIASITLLKPRATSNKWLSGLLQEHAYLNLAEVGYFGEILVDNELCGNGNLTLSTNELYHDAVNWIFNNPQNSDIDSYILATTNLSDEDYSQVINQIKNEIL
jgi:hypothetical protein